MRRSDVEIALGVDLPEPPVIIIDGTEPYDPLHWDKLEEISGEKDEENTFMVSREPPPAEA